VGEKGGRERGEERGEERREGGGKHDKSGDWNGI